MATSNPTLLRAAALAGAIAPVVFITGIIVAGTQFAGYSHLSQEISQLGGVEATAPWIQNTNFILLGLLMVGLAWSLGQVLGRPHRGAILIGGFGVLAAIAQALLPCDAGCDGVTATGLAHILTGLSGFLAAIAATFVLARRWDADPAWRRHAQFTRRIRLVMIGGLVWFIATQALKAEALSGLAQRTFAGSLLFWLSVTGWRTYRAVANQADTHNSADHAPATVSGGR